MVQEASNKAPGPRDPESGVLVGLTASFCISAIGHGRRQRAPGGPLCGQPPLLPAGHQATGIRLPGKKCSTGTHTHSPSHSVRSCQESRKQSKPPGLPQRMQDQLEGAPHGQSRPVRAAPRVTTVMDENTLDAFTSTRSRLDTNNESLLEDGREPAHCFETGKLRKRKEHLSCHF